MPLTPADVANVAFSKPPTGKRGYHEDEVDAFLDLVETELARLIEENNNLRNQVEQFDQQRRAAPVETVAPTLAPMVEQTSPGGDPNVHAARVLGLAQQMADRLTGEAKAEADAMVGQARTQAEQLLSDARVKADGLVNEAKTRVQTMLTDARNRAEVVERQSRDKAALLEREATSRHTEVMSMLSRERSTLEKKIADLRAWEREYRTRLKAYLAVQLRELDGSGSGAPGGPTRSRPGLAVAGTGAHAEAGAR